MSLDDELNRRNDFRAGFACTVVAWLILQVANVILINIDAPDEARKQAEAEGLL